MTAISEVIRDRLLSAGASHLAHDNISAFIHPGELEALEHEVEEKVEGLLRSLVIDHDHNTADTPKRVARMYLHEVFRGRYEPRPDLTDFPNVRRLDELYTVGPVSVRSMCSHHLCSVTGRAWIGVIPGERVIGLSKFNRLTDWVMSRPQIQEEAVMQLADEIEAAIRPQGLGVIIRATHSCMTTRGVREHDTTMTTSVMRGLLREHAARDEFMRIVRGQEF
ncbi:GTP cyclohydrolase I [Paraburkholderia adhaesiva]|uniref:GTP cyclohydrolase I n=1 Tax=Paraburkholderia adhaesiva TaxID=2883244 RepID=UPI001F2B648B|nr:GTP cyclohydrolase I [Paraburkholderia adhaesiva]